MRRALVLLAVLVVAGCARGSKTRAVAVARDNVTIKEASNKDRAEAAIIARLAFNLNSWAFAVSRDPSFRVSTEQGVTRDSQDVAVTLDPVPSSVVDTATPFELVSGWHTQLSKQVAERSTLVVNSLELGMSAGGFMQEAAEFASYPANSLVPLDKKKTMMMRFLSVTRYGEAVGLPADLLESWRKLESKADVARTTGELAQIAVNVASWHNQALAFYIDESGQKPRLERLDPEGQKVIGYQAAFTATLLDFWLQRFENTKKRATYEKELVTNAKLLGVTLKPDPAGLKTKKEALTAYDRYSKALVSQVSRSEFVTDCYLLGTAYGLFSRHLVEIIERKPGQKLAAADRALLAKNLAAMSALAIKLKVSEGALQDLKATRKLLGVTGTTGQLITLDNRVYETYRSIIKELTDIELM